MKRKIKTAIIASRSGTDAMSVMKTYGNGFLPNVDLKTLISTKVGAGCLEKARELNMGSLGMKMHTIDRQQAGSLDIFNNILHEYLAKLEVDLVFLLGCIVKIYPSEKIKMYNIHPADPVAHGGNKMYGLDVHRHVLLDIRDEIKRAPEKIHDQFCTYPTVHEATAEYDRGPFLLQCTVEIPRKIIRDFVAGEIKLGRAAERLQKHVLPYEWEILPPAVNMAARKILDEGR